MKTDNAIIGRPPPSFTKKKWERRRDFWRQLSGLRHFGSGNTLHNFRHYLASVICRSPHRKWKFVIFWVMETMRRRSSSGILSPPVKNQATMATTCSDQRITEHNKSAPHWLPVCLHSNNRSEYLKRRTPFALGGNQLGLAGAGILRPYFLPRKAFRKIFGRYYRLWRISICLTIEEAQIRCLWPTTNGRNKPKTSALCVTLWCAKRAWQWQRSCVLHSARKLDDYR